MFYRCRIVFAEPKRASDCILGVGCAEPNVLIWQKDRGLIVLAWARAFSIVAYEMMYFVLCIVRDALQIRVS